MRCHSQSPVFGVNYDVGYIGFTLHSDDPVGAGIAWFERWDYEGDGGTRVSASGVPPGIVVTHALVVSGPDECIEAHAWSGVQRSTLSKYFNDPHCRIFFRKPRGWTRHRGLDIVTSAASHIGESYGYGLIVADMLADSFVGHWLNRRFRNLPDRIVSKVFDRAGTDVCSELCAKAMQDQFWLRYRGCLRQPARMIEPQALFIDRLVFEDWSQAAAPPANGINKTEIATP